MKRDNEEMTKNKGGWIRSGRKNEVVVMERERKEDGKQENK